MSTLVKKPIQLKLFGAALAMAALAVALLVVVYATGPAQAHNPDPNLNAGKYENPQPCGIHVDHVPGNPDREFSEGHVALFDVYWDYNTQTLNNNLCPPLAVHTPQYDLNDKLTGIVTGRTASNIDVNTTVFHVGNEFKATVVNSDAAGYNPADYTGQRTIDRADYDFLPPAGTVVWWLEQDNPTAEAANPGPHEPELVLGLSAGLLKEADWFKQDCPSGGGACTEVEPLEYHFEAEREPDGSVLPFVVFEDRASEPIWESSKANTRSIRLDPGEYKHYNWVFFPAATQSHTYVLEVHMKGHVRIDVPDGRTKDNWKPLTWPKNQPHNPDNQNVYNSIVAGINKVVTSELVTQEYTIHVGSLTLDEQPMFKAPDRRIPENSAEGTNVGDPVPVTGAGTDTLTYELSGEGHDDFEVESVAQGGQLKVKSGAVLDYEARPTYDLVLSVSDGKNRVGDDDNSRVDSTIAVKITLENVIEPGEVHVTASVSSATASISGSVTFTATPQNLPDGTTRWYALKTVNSDGSPGPTLVSTSLETITWPTGGNRETTGTRSYVVEMKYIDGGTERVVYSNHVTVTWQ